VEEDVLSCGGVVVPEFFYRSRLFSYLIGPSHRQTELDA
jgi:hypothetical protein